MLKNTFIFTLAILFSCSQKKEMVDLIIHHAKICSVDSTFTFYEAMAIKNGKIVEIGKNLIMNQSKQ
jgi:predicted amidohydrolase YtcJ